MTTLFQNLILFVFPILAFGQTFTCPTVEDIKKGQLNNWLPLYVQNEELVSHADFELFKSKISRFSIAKWSKAYLENGHCFYEGNDLITGRIILARDAWRPITTGSWQWLKIDSFAECFQSIQNCGFNS